MKLEKRQSLNILIKTVIIAVLLLGAIGIFELIVGITALKTAENRVPIVSFLKIFDKTIMFCIAYFFYRNYFGIHITKQPLLLSKFKENILINLLIGFLAATIVSLFIIWLSSLLSLKLPFVLRLKELPILTINSVFNSIIYFLASCLIAPIAEEILFRGFWYRLIEQSWNKTTAIYCSPLRTVDLLLSIFRADKEGEQDAEEAVGC